MKLGTIIFMIGQLVVGGLGSLAIIILFFSGIYILFAKSIALGLMLIGASVVASWIIYLLSGSLMALGMKLSENAALKLEENLEQAWVEAVPNEEKRIKIDADINKKRIDPSIESISDEDVDEFISQITNSIKTMSSNIESSNLDEQEVEEIISKVKAENEIKMWGSESLTDEEKQNRISELMAQHKLKNHK